MVMTSTKKSAEWPQVEAQLPLTQLDVSEIHNIIMSILASEALLHENRKFQQQKVAPQ